MDENSVIPRANSLLKELLSSYDEKYHHGTIISGIYDTAWISMVPRKTEASSVPEWAYPVCFEFLCQNQAEDGGWGNPVSLVDRITCTLVSLLAIKKHLRVSGNPLVKDRLSLQHQAARAIDFIHLNIERWDLDSLDTRLPIGFELWFPVVVEKLEEEGVVFQIPGKDRIVELRRKKLSRFPLDVLYKPTGLVQPTPLFTLEGFIGLLDFSKLSHHLRFGSMFSSPSSTAVYLMECTVWDVEADAYLQHVVDVSILKHGYCVPQMFPTFTFDIDWVLNLFVDGGLDLKKLDADTVNKLGNMMLQCLEDQGGIMGSNRNICPDPDSTAMAYKTIYYTLGLHYPIQPIIDAFEGDENYFTYCGERDPSISSNAHALQALILSPESRKHTSSIEKCIKYLCGTWYNTHDLVEDKWSNSEYYATLAITQALSDYVFALSDERVEAVSEKLLKVHIPMTIFQAVVRILLRQNGDGSWGSTSIRVDTSHAVILLKSTRSLPFIPEALSLVVGQAIQKGQAFISANLDAPFNDYSWNGKCAYGLSSISRAAALSALLDSQPTRVYSPTVQALYQVDSNLITKQNKLLGCMKYFTELPAWIIEASCVEAAFFVRELVDNNRLETRKNYDKGFTLKLAVICTAVNYATKACLGNHILLGMLECMEFAYHLDTLIDLELKDRSVETMQLIEKLVRRMFADIDPSVPLQDKLEGDAITLRDCQDHEEVYRVLKAMASGKKLFMENPRVLTASPYEQHNLLMELRLSLLAQVSKASIATTPDDFHETGLSFYQYIQGIAAYDGLSGIAMKFIICLNQGPSDVVCATPVERYLLEEYSRHVAVWGRMWNDYADVERDRADSNLNSLDFPDFQTCTKDPREDSPGGVKRRYLAVLIQHEEDLANETLTRFTSLVESRANAGNLLTGLRWYLGILHVLRELYNTRAIYAAR
ncbi:hypothetical protein PENARI_c096G01623 [Penicillium arizonense]|uniref:Uncharacterized protein n=1 Tax=Penicillium arizonense TaxID=1835702 RepID=A0A1F5L1D7_PENAI|nr:hypothetical protein PENARI_c096G01623 [Penicillium arizonense]OGE46866.1 hypothetical protein PENARI_c096G01623 [Penicillium arizonense]